jgi:hypothetical protein
MSKDQVFLCKCNNCESILIDTNPQADAQLHSLKGGELKTLVLIKDMQACPVCLTDAYLTDDIGVDK